MLLDKIYTICYGVYTMKRYQLYLNPHAVAIIDDFEKESHISRSKLIRHLVERVADQVLDLILVKTDTEKKKYFFDTLAGFIDLKTKKKTNLAQRVDEIYLTD